MPSLEVLSAIGGFSLVAIFFLWYALRQSKKQGIAEQLARDNKIVAETESAIHGVQAEHRDPEETKKRLKGGTF